MEGKEKKLSAKRKRIKSVSDGRIERTHIYKNNSGNPVFKKIKYKPSSEGEKWAFHHWDGTRWRPRKGNHDDIPYNLHKFSNHEKVIICEGEKDVDTLSKMFRNPVVTSAPHGKGSWSDSITPHFRQFKKIIFLYDVGNEEFARKHAKKLHVAFPESEIRIAKVPMREVESDITDYLETFEEKKVKSARLKKILIESKKFEAHPTSISLGEFLEKEIPEREIIVQFHAEKEAVSILAGANKRGKSLYAVQMGLSVAQGRDFLDFYVPEAKKVLYIQQEISEPSMKERLTIMNSDFSVEESKNFFMLNTVGNILKLTNTQDIKVIHGEIKKREPDLVIFDPFSTFHCSRENDAKEMSEVMDALYEIAIEFKCGVFIIHHHGKPALVERQGGHLLRGHSVIADRADIIINFNALPKKYEKIDLRLPIQNYGELSFILRSDASPNDLIIQRNPLTLLYERSRLNEEYGIQIIEIIQEIIRENGGEIMQKELVDIIIQEGISRNAIFKSLQTAKDRDLIEAEAQEGRGSPRLLKIKERHH